MLERARIREVYAEAASLPDAQRRDFLDRECAGDDALRSEVESLLAAMARQPEFMTAPTLGVSTPGDLVEAAGTQIGPYRLLEEIGQGGFGSVFMAEQESPIRRRVALKIIKLGMDTRAVIARFEAERQALAMMDHEHIAKVLDAGATESGRPYFVMELVEGEPITAYCDKANLSIAERLDVFVQVCRAVQHAHSKGVIHRDIKPGNVLVASKDGRPHAKVIDFGIAKATERDRGERTAFTEHRQLIGTPEYMSPEQAGGAPDVDARSDVYSLGVLLYELLTGATPFDAKELRSAAFAEIQRIIREVDPPKPSTRLSRSGDGANVALLRRTQPNRLNALVTGDLDWIVMKALEKDRARRYETPSALASDIERHLGGEVVLAAPPSRGYRVRKFVRRNRAAVLAGVAVGAALVLGVVGTTVGMVKATREQHRAEVQSDIATREADQARAINDFMRHVLTSVEPENQGSDVRLKDVLAEASTSASDRFAGHPLLEAQVRHMLGNSYFRLSLWEKSQVEYRRALALFQASGLDEDPRALTVELNVLEAELNSGHVRQMEPALVALLPRLDRALGADDLITLQARRIMADVLTRRGRTDEAEAILVALRNNPRLADDRRLQIQLLQGLFRAYRARPDSHDRASELKFWGEVVTLGRECVALASGVHGPTSMHTLQAQNHLAGMLYNHEEFAASAEVSRSVLAGSSEKLGECHHVREIAMGTLASALARLGEVDEAAELKLRRLACLREIMPGDKIALVSSIAEALHFLDRAGRAAEGEALARESKAELAKFGGHVSTFRSELFIAQFASIAGRSAEAESLFQPLRATAEASGNQFAQACVELGYARHWTRTGQYQESERCLERCVTLRGDITLGTYDGLPDDIIFAYIELYKAWQRTDKVREYEALRQTAFGIAPRSP